MGVVVLLTVLTLLAVCVNMFANLGKGTLAPWAPTQRLVVLSLYSYMRNPMITGVLLSLLGGSIILSNTAVFLWFLFFFLGNHLYFIKSEEPGLLKRFGVPRWLPRRSPWTNSREQEN